MAKSGDERLGIQKTYKMYIGGKFPRTESGRYYVPQVKGKPLGNLCLASRKDVRNAVVAARGAQAGWASRSAYNRSQILYRIGEMLEGRRDQFAEEIVRQGLTPAAAKREVEVSIDRAVYYAGWCDKFQQVFSSVNPVASSHFNFSVLEPMGVVFLVANEDSPLLGLISLLIPIIAGGNACVALASQSKPLSAVTLCEVLDHSDLPGGVVNLLTGDVNELGEHFAKHLDINAIACNRAGKTLRTSLNEHAVENVKRVFHLAEDWTKPASENPYLIRSFCEVKTTWHPIEQISASGSGY